MELEIRLTYRSKTGWGYAAYFGDRLLGARPAGAFKTPSDAFKQALDDVHAAKAAARERIDGGA